MDAFSLKLVYLVYIQGDHSRFLWRFRMKINLLMGMAMATAMACLAAALTLRPTIASESPPPLAWPVPGYPNPDGTPVYPLWDGTAFVDSARSTGAGVLWELGITGFGVSAAVLDTPYQTGHSAISGSIIANASAGFSLGGNGLHPYVDGMTVIGQTEHEGEEIDIYFLAGLGAISIPGADFEEVGHGTHVASTVIGMAPDARLVLTHSAHYGGAWRGLDDLEEFSLGASAAALAYAAEIASQYNIIAVNNSWGDNYFFGVHEAALAEAEFPEIRDALRALAGAGVVPVFASGNEAVNNAIIVPGAMSDAVAVGALNQFGVITDFSNQNAKVVLLAPGQDIYAAVPYDGYEAWPGTSMATPHVTGAIALLASGARGAMADEILEALVETADPVVYDGSLLLPAAVHLFSVEESSETYQDIFDALYEDDLLPESIVIGPEHTQDEWRRMRRYIDIINTVHGNLSDPTWEEFKDEFAEVYETFPGDFTLEHTDYRFLRVDKAYQYLTQSHLTRKANEIAPAAPQNAAFLRALAAEFGLELSQQTADLTRRFSELDAGRLAHAAREIGPAFHASALEYAHMGLAGVHDRLAARNGRQRANLRVGSEPIAVHDATALANFECHKCKTTELWLEGHAAAARRSGTLEAGRYDGRSAGFALGIERAFENLIFGAFGDFADYRVKGEGKASGQWYSGGLYGGWNAGRFYMDASAAFHYGDFDASRYMRVHGAFIADPGDPAGGLVLDPILYRTEASSSARGVGGSLGAGFDLFSGDGWTVGPRAQASASWLRRSAFSESGAGVLDLRLDGADSGYAEGGLGITAQALIGGSNGAPRFVARAQVMGLYGEGFGDSLGGHFRNGGTRFEVSHKRLRTAWAAPSADMTWKVSSRLDITARYDGRFGRHYQENAGTLGLNLWW